jgi:hypothetical protein
VRQSNGTVYTPILTSRIGYRIFKQKYLVLASFSQSVERPDVAHPRVPFHSRRRLRRLAAASNLVPRGRGLSPRRHRRYHSLVNLWDLAELLVPASRSRAHHYHGRNLPFEDLKSDRDLRSRLQLQKLLLGMRVQLLASLDRAYGVQRTRGTQAKE